MTISTEQLLFDADTLHSNNFFKTDAFLTKVLFQKEVLLHTDIQYLYYYYIISLIFYLHVFQYSYFLEKANFSEKQYPALPTLSGELLFRSG